MKAGIFDNLLDKLIRAKPLTHKMIYQAYA